LREEKKTGKIWDKIIEGKLKKFYRRRLFDGTEVYKKYGYTVGTLLSTLLPKQVKMLLFVDLRRISTRREIKEINGQKKEKAIYKRILLKLSGESLLGKQPFGIDPDVP